MSGAPAIPRLGLERKARARGFVWGCSADRRRGQPAPIGGDRTRRASDRLVMRRTVHRAIVCPLRLAQGPPCGKDLVAVGSLRRADSRAATSSASRLWSRLAAGCFMSCPTLELCEAGSKPQRRLSALGPGVACDRSSAEDGIEIHGLSLGVFWDCCARSRRVRRQPQLSFEAQGSGGRPGCGHAPPAPQRRRSVPLEVVDDRLAHSVVVFLAHVGALSLLPLSLAQAVISGGFVLLACSPSGTLGSVLDGE